MDRSHQPMLLAAFVLTGCLLDSDFKHRNTSVPEPLDDGWAIATPAEVGLDPDALARIHAELLEPEKWVGALGFLVVKDAKLVFETYLRQTSDRDHVHHLQSVTKSITSLVVGMGRDKGWFPDPSTTLCSVLSEACAGLDAKRQSITFDQLLTMRSGIAFDNDDFSVEMWVDQPSQPVRYILEKPLYADPGTRFYYRDADPQLVGYAVRSLTQRTEEELASEYLFGPLGISDWYWDHGPEGTTMAAHGLHLRPRHFARIGQLMLDSGSVNGEPLVSSAWLAASQTKQADPDWTTRFGYGYYWWIVPEANGYAAWGHGGQFLFVVPEQHLVLTLVSMPDTDADRLHGGMLEQFVDLTRPLWQPTQ
jgi:CubicO group peptidase (beta-lactamase class C family)